MLLRRVLPLALALSLCSATSAAADPVDDYANQVADHWVAAQKEDGGSSDWLHGGASGAGGYAESMLGYGLIGAGLRTGNSTQVEAGLRSVNWVFTHEQARAPSVFEFMALASAYNQMNAAQLDNATFQSIKPAWEAWLRGFTAVNLRGTSSYSNKHLVEAVATTEALRTGLTSEYLPAVLGDRDLAAWTVKQLFERGLAQREKVTVGHAAGSTTVGISDPGASPVAYQALAAGMLARVLSVQAAAGQVPTLQEQQLLSRAVNAICAYAGPDGDIAYSGRSQQEAWTLGLAAYAAYVAARYDSQLAPRFRALAYRTLTRLLTVHGLGDQGVWIVPALRADPAVGAGAVDSYAASSAYNGLTLVALNWALEARDGSPAGVLPADSNTSAVFPWEGAGFAVRRAGKVWMAVRQRSAALGTGESFGDLRDDFGLAALKRYQDGQWTDLVPDRPVTRGTHRADSAGPILRAGGRTAYATGYATRIVDGKIVVRGGFKTRKGAWVRRGVTFVFAPTASGVTMKFAARKGDTLEVSAFLEQAPKARPGWAADSKHTVQIGGGKGHKVKLTGGLASGLNPHITRARFTFKAKGGHVKVAWAGR